MAVLRSDFSGLTVSPDSGGTKVSVTQNNCGCCGGGGGQGTGTGTTGSEPFTQPGGAAPPLGDPTTPGTTPGSPPAGTLPGQAGDIHRVAPTCLPLADPFTKPYGSEGFALDEVDLKAAITSTATAATLLKSGESLKSAKVAVTGYCFMRLKAPGGIAINSDPGPLQYTDSSGTHLIFSKLYSGSAVADFLYYDQVINVLCDSAVTMSGELPSMNKLLFANQSPAVPSDTAWIKCCLNEVVVGQTCPNVLPYSINFNNEPLSNPYPCWISTQINGTGIAGNDPCAYPIGGDYKMITPYFTPTTTGNLTVVIKHYRGAYGVTCNGAGGTTTTDDIPLQLVTNTFIIAVTAGVPFNLLFQASGNWFIQSCSIS